MQEAQKRPEGPQKVLVFSTFVQALHVMADILAHAKLGFVMLHGAMDLDERSEVGTIQSDPASPCHCLLCVEITAMHTHHAPAMFKAVF